MTFDRARLEAQLTQHEGLRLKPYTDSVGKLTIGVGRNLTDKGITRAEAETLLDHDIDDTTIQLIGAASWVERLDPIRIRVLIDMGFNMGVPGLLKFKGTLAAVKAGNYALAAHRMNDSLWARQVGQRAVRLRQMMTDGKELF